MADAFRTDRNALVSQNDMPTVKGTANGRKGTGKGRTGVEETTETSWRHRGECPACAGTVPPVRGKGETAFPFLPGKNDPAYGASVKNGGIFDGIFTLSK